MWRGQDWWLLCPIYLHELGNSLQRTSERVSFVFLIDAFGALVIPYVLAPVVHIEAKGPQPTSCFSRFRPCCIQFPFVLRGYPPLSLELDLKEFPFAPRPFPPTRRSAGLQRRSLGSPPWGQRCVRQDNFPSLGPPR